MGSKVGSCGKLATYFVVCLNLLVVALGFTFLTIGVWILIDENSFQTAVTQVDPSLTRVSRIETGGVVLTCSGLLLLIPALTGCYGAAFRNPCVLSFYTILVSSCLLLQFAIGLYILMYKQEANTSVKNWLVSNINSDFNGTNLAQDSNTPFWDQLFISFQCCGINNGSDFLPMQTKRNSTGVMLPMHCCRFRERNKGRYVPCLASETTSHYNKGCYEAAIKNLMDHRNIVGSVLLGITAGEVLLIICSVYLIRASKNNKIS